MSACTGAALSAAYIIVYCVVVALSACVCYYALDSGGLVGWRVLLRLNGYDSLRDRSTLYIWRWGCLDLIKFHIVVVLVGYT